tara:strand:- start:1183 stop:1284 length:102 start_codon:yes stop_codon:yes gene_type:complete
MQAERVIVISGGVETLAFIRMGEQTSRERFLLP